MTFAWPVRNEVVESDQRLRILEISSTSVFVISLDDPLAVPSHWHASKFLSALGKGELKRSADTLLPAISNSFTANAVALRDRRWTWIEGLVCDSSILHTHGRGALVRHHAAKVHASPQTVMACLRMYWQGGQTKDALFPNYHRCGLRLKTDVPECQSRRTGGRKSRSHDRFVFTEEDIARVIPFAREMFFERKTVTRKKLYRAILKQFYSYKNSDGKRKLLPLGESPTPRQFNYEFNKTILLSDKIKRDKSEAEFQNDHAPKLGTVFDDCVCVGHVYEIDSTIVDLWIVARDNRHKIIGKATLYLIIDRFSRLIVGFHLSLDKPSWETALEAILTLVEDKQQLCKRWGATYRPDSWPGHGYLPESFVADRGAEFTSVFSDQLVDGIHCTVINAPSQRASRKGTVECAFKLVHVQLKDEVAAYDVPSDAFKRQGKHYEKDAQYTLDELAAEFIDIIHLHNHRIHPGLRIETTDVLDGAAPIPVEIWRRDLERSAGSLSRISAVYLRAKLLPAGRAVVTQNGISLNHCFYTCARAKAEEWFIQASINRFKVDVSYDRRLVDRIFVHNPKDPRAQPEIAVLTSASAMYAGMSVAEVFAVDDMRRRSAPEAERYNIGLEVEYEDASEARGAAAFDATCEAIAESEGSREDKKQVLRKAEAKARRTGKAKQPKPDGVAAQPHPMQSAVPDAMDDLIDALLRLDQG